MAVAQRKLANFRAPELTYRKGRSGLIPTNFWVVSGLGFIFVFLYIGINAKITNMGYVKQNLDQEITYLRYHNLMRKVKIRQLQSSEYIEKWAPKLGLVKASQVDFAPIDQRIAELYKLNSEELRLSAQKQPARNILALASRALRRWARQNKTSSTGEP